MNNSIEVSSIEELYKKTKGKTFYVKDFVAEKALDYNYLESEYKYKITLAHFKFKFNFKHKKGEGYFYLDKNGYFEKPVEIYLDIEEPLKLKSRSVVNTEVLKYFIKYMKSDPITLRSFVGSYAHIMDEKLQKAFPELFEDYSIPYYKYEFSSKYGKEWYLPTFRQAVDSIKGKGFTREWMFLNSKKSTRSKLNNPKYFSYDIDGNVVYPKE